MQFQMTIWFENEPGVLDRALAVFSRRRISLTHMVMRVLDDGDSMRADLWFPAENLAAAERVQRQVERGVEVTAVDLASGPALVAQEICRVKVGVGSGARRQVVGIAAAFCAEVTRMHDGHVSLQLTGTPERVEALLTALQAWPLEEVHRTTAGDAHKNAAPPPVDSRLGSRATRA